MIKALAISVLQHEVPQGRSGISRKFARFNFLAIARNISRLILKRYLQINLGILRDSNQIPLQWEASNLSTEPFCLMYKLGVKT